MKLLLIIAIALSLGSPAFSASSEAGSSGSRGPMPDRVYGVFRQAIMTLPAQPAADGSRQQNLQALQNLRSVDWPDLEKWEWSALTFSPEFRKQYPGAVTGIHAWRLRQAGPPILLMPDFTERKFEAAAIANIQPVPFGDDLHRLVSFLQQRRPGSARPYDFTFFADFGSLGFPFYRGVFYLHYAYAAASIGEEGAARTLIHQALQDDPLAFRAAYNEGAWQSFVQGIDLLDKNAPRSDVLTQWEGTIRSYGHSEYGQQVQSYVTLLRQQVEEDKQLAAAPPQDPEKLPLEEKVAYYIARWPDVHGVQWSQPGICFTASEPLSKAVSKLGRPAVPWMIQHLRDRRLTRSIGFWRNFDPHRTVLRVQDVAYQCLQSVIGINFLQQDCPDGNEYLSVASPKVQDKVIVDITRWWNENGNKTPLQGYLSRLHSLTYQHVGTRLETLERIEKIDPHAVNGAALVKKWAAELPPDDEYMAVMARELAKRGDLSLVPAMIRRLRNGNGRGYEDECIWLAYHYGSPTDLEFLRQQVHRAVVNGFSMGTSVYLWTAEEDLKDVHNRLAIPIMVEMLRQRQIIGSRLIPGQGYQMDVSTADRFMPDLIRLTGHNEGYLADAPRPDRFAAMDRWLAWWNQAGKHNYLHHG